MSEQCFSIEVTNISKTFSGRKVLDNVSISVQRGSICGLVGRNGCGKTVLMKCICGFIVPEIGQIKLGRLMEGHYRKLTNDEIKYLKSL